MRKLRTVLGPGLMSCPRCGNPFDEPVPDDATPDAAEEIVATVTPPAVSLPPVELPPLAVPPAARRPSRLPKLAWALAVVLALVGLGWAAYPFVSPFALRLPFLRPAPTVILPVANVTTDKLPTDLAAHPGYAANMAEFVRSLRASGVEAQWPAFGSADTLLITPQTVVNGQRAEWTADLYHELAQGVYANFVFRRYESKFSDTDSTTCFIVVSDSSGKVVAADLMGNLQ